MRKDGTMKRFTILGREQTLARAYGEAGDARTGEARVTEPDGLSLALNETAAGAICGSHRDYRGVS
jgi:hypothetical protein